MNDLQMATELRRAADGVRKAWWDGGDEVAPHAQCAQNWLLFESAGSDRALTANYPVLELVEDRLGVGRDGVPGWNDAPGRTKEDVIALFEGLAHDLELRHQVMAMSNPVEQSHDSATIPSLEAVPVA